MQYIYEGKPVKTPSVLNGRTVREELKVPQEKNLYMVGQSGEYKIVNDGTPIPDGSQLESVSQYTKG